MIFKENELENIIEDETRKQWQLTHRKPGFKRFYSYPPVECEHPWVLRNIKQKKIPCVHEIVDIGIYDLLAPPFKHSTEKLEKWKNLKVENGWKVVPDCPDLKGEFSDVILNKLLKNLEKFDFTVVLWRYINYWWNYLDSFDNTEYSWELLEDFYIQDDVSHLPVLQSKYGDMESLKEYIKKFKDKYGVVDKIAVGSICKLDDNKLGVHMLKEVRRAFYSTWIHAFGLRFVQFKRVFFFIDSFDSSAWTFPREPGRGTCKNKNERVQFFNDYLKQINEIINKNRNKEQRLIS